MNNTHEKWEVSNQVFVKDIALSGPIAIVGHGVVCYVSTSHYGLNMAKDHAKLIAAAPDLLAALQAMDELDKCEHLSDKWWEQATKADILRALAIKKATK